MAGRRSPPRGPRSLGARVDQQIVIFLSHLFVALGASFSVHRVSGGVGAREKWRDSSNEPLGENSHNSLFFKRRGLRLGALVDCVNPYNFYLERFSMQGQTKGQEIRTLKYI